ncbi:MAG TPA: hypothetical protein VI197_06070 [Polyangiaceae bacterium]
MGIDGIHKPGGRPPDLETGGAPGADGEFKANLETAPNAPAAPPTPSAALQRLDAGDISVEEYLDLQVNEAVAHLAGKLPPNQLEFVRESLREQLTEDPVLVELVRRTTLSAGSSGAGSAR